MTERDRPIWRDHRVVDPVIAAVLLVTGYLVRRAGLPTDGLWYDDAWEATGASKGALHQLLIVGTNHPGFSFVLMVWSRLVAHRSELMVWPVMAVGVVAAPLLYLALRRWRVVTGVAVLVSGALVVSTAHVQYSTRVKGYVFETLGVLALAIVLPRLARITWRWSLVAGWVVCAVLLGTLSPFLIVASAVAMLLLVAQGTADDRVQRIVALGVQGVVQAIGLVAVQGTFDSGQLTKDWDEKYAGYIEWSGGPVHMVKVLGSHVSRVGQVVAAGRGAVPALLVVIAVVGLGLAARRGDRSVTARFLLALPVVALLGAVAKVIPFGPSNSDFLSPGWRASLWLLPSLLVGLAFALDAAVRWLAKAEPRSLVPVTLVLVALTVALVVDHWDPHTVQPLSGSRTAKEFMHENLGPRDVGIVFSAGLFPYAVEPGVPVRIERAQRSLNGFAPVPTDPRIWVLSQRPWDGSDAQLRRRTANADRVLVHDGFPGFGDSELPALEAALRRIGFVEVAHKTFGGGLLVERWDRRR